MNSKQLNGFILSRKDFGEADRLLLVFTREEGKIKIVARGARKIKSRLACQIEPFSYGKLCVAQGKNMYVLTGAETKGECENIAKSAFLYSAYSYISELFSALLPENESQSDLYDTFLEIIVQMKRQKNNDNRLILLSEIQLLKNLGYLSDIKYCNKCLVKLEKQKYYSGDLAGIYCTICSKINNIELNTYKFLRLLYDFDLKRISAIKLSKELQIKTRKLTEEFFNEIIQRKLKSKELLK